MSLTEAQLSLLQKFELGLDPRQPERSRIPATVLGYGEISTVFAIQAEGFQDLAFKRLPLFRSAAEIEAYRIVYEEYNRLLQAEIGLRLPGYSYAYFTAQSGRPIFYIIQQRLPSSSIGNKALHVLPREGVLVLVERTLQELRRVWDFNRRQNRVRVAIDGQISNWSIDDFDDQHPYVDQKSVLTYVDTSTPLYRVGGAEQLDVELFLRSAPSFLVWILRRLFLADVVNRYYDLRRVAIDLVANFYKEQRPDLIPGVLGTVNEFFTQEVTEPGILPLGIAPIEDEEVRAYYREDAQIWTLYLAMRRFDRFLHTRLLRREYPYILPGKITR